MIFTDNKSMSSTVKANLVKDNNQSIRIDSLQSAIDEINNTIVTLQANINSLNTTIDDKYLAQTNSLAAKVTEAVNTLKTELNNSITSTNIIADYVQSDKAVIEEVSSDLVNADNVTAEILNNTTANIDDATIDTLSVTDTAALNKATIQYLTAVNAIITNLDMDSLSTDSIESNAAIISNMSAQIANITRLNANIITVADGGTWREPVGTPDNTELLKITVPYYDGITNIIAENNVLNVSIFNNTFLTFNQDDHILYRLNFVSAPNIASSYSHIVIQEPSSDKYVFELGVPEDLDSIEFEYNGAQYKYNKSQLNVDVDAKLHVGYADNTITFTATEVVTIADVIVYDEKDSGKNDVELFLVDSTNYKEIHIGDSTYKASYSELVDKTYYPSNVVYKSGSMLASPLITGESNDLSVVLADKLPNSYTGNTLYVIYNDTTYYSKTGESIVQIAASIKDVLKNKQDIKAINDSIGQPNGIASLDSEGHIPVEQMPVSALIYKGQYDASTGVAPVQSKYVIGDFYIISKEGTINGTKYYVNDWIIWNGTAWERSANANAVASVNGMKGEVTISLDDLGGQEELVSGTNIKTINGNSILGAGNITLADLGITIV